MARAGSTYKDHEARPCALFPGNWRILSKAQHKAAKEGFARELAELSTEQHSLRVGEIRVCDAPFYQNTDVWAVDVYSGKRFMGVLDALRSKGQFIRLTGKSPPIHALNLQQGIDIDTTDRAKAYLTFFCNAVHGDLGAFAIYPHWSQIPLASEDSNDVLDALSKAFPNWLDIELSKADEGNAAKWRGSTCIFYGNHLFRAQMTLEASGMVRMNEDKPLTEDLPLRAMVYRSGLRRYEQAHVD